MERNKQDNQKQEIKNTSMNRIMKVLLVTTFIFLFFVKQTFAFSFSITSVDPANITSNEQEVSVNLSIEDLPSGDSYFRAGWDSGNTYVGYIKNNNGDWVALSSLSSSDCLNYYKISSATSSATLKIKIGSNSNISNGNVDIRAHRLTSTCASNTGSNLFSTQINLPTIAPTPSPAPTQKPSTPSPTILPTPTKSPTPAKTPNETLEPEVLSETVEVLNLTSTPTVRAEVLSDSKKGKFPIFAIVIITLGILLIAFSGYLAYKMRYNNRSETKN